MKTSLRNSAGRPALHHRFQTAFTLPEMMVSLTLFILVTLGIMYAYIYGLRMYEFTKPKLDASDEGRKALNKLTHEIRAANIIRIGNGNLGTFTEVPTDTLQRGSAIQLFPTTDTNRWIRYYWDMSQRKLMRTTNGMTAAYVIANSVSNQLVFTSEDHLGNVLTNNFNNRVIGLTLQFYQIQYPVMQIGPGNYYDYYQLRTKITRRTLL